MSGALFILAASLFFLGSPAASPKAVIVAFLSPDCPLSRRAVTALNALAENGDGVEVRGLLPRAASDGPELRDFRAAENVRFALGADPDLKAARAIGATVTPEVFLLDSAGTILYRGAVDDRSTVLGKKRARVGKAYLRDALAEWKRGAPVSVPRVAAVGCYIE
jgi:hypothetical protein